jgi:hypothetical protein
MNQRALAVAGALLFSAGLAAPLPGVGVPAAGAGNPHGKFHVEWASSVRLDGQNRIHGYVRNDSGGTVEDLWVVVSGLDAKGHEISQIVRPLPGVVHAGDRMDFDVKVPSSPTHRVEVK